MSLYTVRVWDLPTRCFHWSLAACVVGLVITGNVGGNAMVWHGRLGYAVLSLLLFRVVWGLVGGHWSRFSVFLHGPARVLAYLRGQGQATDAVGHNPLGAGSVLAMLLFLLAQVASGLLSDDEIAYAGPLARHASGALVSWATGYHKEVGKLILIALVALHLAAIAFYRVKKRQNLVPPMIHGDKTLDFEVPPARDDAGSRWLGLGLYAGCAALVAVAVKWLG